MYIHVHVIYIVYTHVQQMYIQLSHFHSFCFLSFTLDYSKCSSNKEQPSPVNLAPPPPHSAMSLSGSGKQDRVKLAIQSEPPLPPKQPLLLDVAQNLPLASIIRDVCVQWNVENPKMYTFKYADLPPSSAASASGRFGYITEENRSKLKNGDILRLTLTPPIAAEGVYAKVRSKSNDERTKAVNDLLKLSKDYSFALEFIKLDGITCLTSLVEASQLVNDVEIEQLGNILGAFTELMEHGIVSWDSLTENFVKKLINFIDKSLMSHEYFRPNVVSKSLSILESIVLNSSKFYQTVSNELSVSTPIPFLAKSSQEVKYNTLAFINAMIAKAQNRHDVMRELALNAFSRNLHESILNHFHGEVPQEIAHELYVYQCHVMNMVEGRMKMKFVSGDPKMEEDVRLLPARAFPDEYSGHKSRAPISDQHWKQLGFVTGDPQDEFSETPPGILALDCMVHFAKSKHDTFTKLLFSYAECQCPFAQTSIALTKVLCQIFRIGEPPSDLGYEFIPVLVWSEEPFKEVFCITIQLIFKTWREMRASVLDLEKVMVVVTKQITTVLQGGGPSLTSFDVFRQRLFDLSYKKITQTEESSQLLDENVLKSGPVQELVEHIKPELMLLIREERLRHLIEGQSFPRSSRRRDQYFYCRLSQNHKMLHFGDTTSATQAPPIESLDKKIQVSEMRLEVGQNCPHFATIKRGHAATNIFSVFYEGDEHLDFIAPNETVFNIWVDGLSSLCGRMMPSKASVEDLETLMNMELKIRLLDIENVTIPSGPPAIPKEPADYDFYYKLDN